MKTTVKVLSICCAVLIAASVFVPQPAVAHTSWGISVGSGGTTFFRGSRHHRYRTYHPGWYPPGYVYPSLGLAGPTVYYDYVPRGYLYSPGYVGFRYIHY